jgi:hypothetical protein
MPIGEASAPPSLRSPDRMDGHVQKRPYLARLGVQHRELGEAKRSPERIKPVAGAAAATDRAKGCQHRFMSEAM